MAEQPRKGYFGSPIFISAHIHGRLTNWNLSLLAEPVNYLLLSGKIWYSLDGFYYNRSWLGDEHCWINPWRSACAGNSLNQKECLLPFLAPKNYPHRIPTCASRPQSDYRGGDQDPSSEGGREKGWERGWGKWWKVGGIRWKKLSVTWSVEAGSGHLCGTLCGNRIQN